jgi:hypothetical protein
METEEERNRRRLEEITKTMTAANAITNDMKTPVFALPKDGRKAWRIRKSSGYSSPAFGPGVRANSYAAAGAALKAINSSAVSEAK